MLRFHGLVAAGALPIVILAINACSSDEVATVQQPAGDAGPAAARDAAGGGDDDDDVTEKDAGTDAGPRPAPVFLKAADYADLIEIDPEFPFDVTQMHDADGDILGSHWGRHGGPMVTLGTYGNTNAPAVVQWTLPAKATDAATSTGKPFVKASGLPEDLFYGADGMVDLPFGSLSLLDYSESGSPFKGEAFIYDRTYQTVKSRAKANGFYSGAGIADGKNGLLVYSGLSALAKDDSDINESGLYVTGICDDTLLAPAPCPASRKLFGWKGNSGSVVTDRNGNVFVAASLTNGDTSDAVYGLGRTEVTSGGATVARPIAAVDSGGTASLAVVAPENTESGWVLGLGYADTSPIYAAPYTASSSALKAGRALIAEAITRASGVDGMSMFTDAEGDLWLAVIKGDKGTYLELRRKTP